MAGPSLVPSGNIPTSSIFSGDSYLHHANLCKAGAKVQDVINRYEDGQLMMKECDVEDINFDRVRVSNSS